MRNAAKLGFGVNVSKYTGSRGKLGANDSDAELLAQVRALLDKNKVAWQLTELGKVGNKMYSNLSLQVDEGGGGTIAWLIARKQFVINATSLHRPHGTYG